MYICQSQSPNSSHQLSVILGFSASRRIRFRTPELFKSQLYVQFFAYQSYLNKEALLSLLFKEIWGQRTQKVSGESNTQAALRKNSLPIRMVFTYPASYLPIRHKYISFHTEGAEFTAALLAHSCWSPIFFHIFMFNVNNFF